MEEIIHSLFHPPPPQVPIALPNQNQTLSIVLLWVICVSIVYGPNGVGVYLLAQFYGTKVWLKFWHCLSLEKILISGT